MLPAMNDELSSTMGAALRALVDYAEGRGVDVDAVVASSPIDRRMLTDRTARLPSVAADALFAAIVRASGDRLLHLRMVPHMPPKAFRVIDYLGSNARTVGEGMAAVCRFFAIVHQSIRLDVEVDGDVRRVVYRPRRGYDGAFTLAIFIARFAIHCGDAATPTRAELVRGPLGDPALERALFGAEVVYHRPRDLLVYTAAQWAAPMPEHDAVLEAVLEQHAETLSAELTLPETLAEQVGAALRPLLGEGRVELRHVAKRLGMSARTLQRRLRQDGTSFATVLDETRQAMAQTHLADRSLTVMEVAFMLGYADESAFHRAHKRWHGQSPGEWRGGRG